MVSSYTPHVPLDPSHTPTFFPGADGCLYHYNRQREQLEKIPVSIVELAEQSPSITGHGAPVLSERETRLFYLHRRTGRLLSSFATSPADDAALAVPGSAGGAAEGAGVTTGALSGTPPDQVLVAGRVTYRVHAQNPWTHETLWNVTYSMWTHLQLPAIDRPPPAPLLDMAAGLLELPEESGLTLSHNVLWAQHGGGQTWSQTFPAPPTFIVRSQLRRGGEGEGVPVLPAAPQLQQGGILVTLQDALARVARTTATSPRRPARRAPVVVGQVEGSLYALPVDAGSGHRAARLGWAPGSLRPQLALPNAAGVERVASGAERSVVVQASQGHGEASDFMCPGDVPQATSVPQWLPPQPLPLPAAPSETDHPGLPPGGLLSLAIATTLAACFGLLLFSMLTYSTGRQRPPPDLTAIGATQERRHDRSDSIPARLLSSQSSFRTPSGDVAGALHRAASKGDDGAVAAAAAASSTRHSQVSDKAAADAEEARMSTQSPNPFVAPAERRLADGRVIIGALEISPVVLGYGSSTHGTVVFEGTFHGRPVAVKRMLAQFHGVARKEMDALIASDEHPNVLRCFAWERSGDFVYLALERCHSTLYDALSQPDALGRFTDPASGRVTALTWQIMRDTVEGVSALHSKGIVHRDLKPQNVLLTDALRGKVSDMGLSKTMAAHQSSFDSLGLSGSSGWQAPEQMLPILPSGGGSGSGGGGGCGGGGASGSGGGGGGTGSGNDSGSAGQAPHAAALCGARSRQSKAVDIFSLGLVLFWTFTAGGHPFGMDRYHRDGNILQAEPDLAPLAVEPELQNLIAAMLKRDPKQRPSIDTVLAHPVWWPPARKLQFLTDTSDRFELQDRAPNPSMLRALEATSPSAFPPGDNWAAALEPALIGNLVQYRRYKYSNVRDLLRIIRNKMYHFRELSPELQALIGDPPDGYYAYYAARFPRLLLTMVFFVVEAGVHTEPLFAKFCLGELSWEACATVHAASGLPPRPRGAVAAVPQGIIDLLSQAQGTAASNGEDARDAGKNGNSSTAELVSAESLPSDEASRGTMCALPRPDATASCSLDLGGAGACASSPSSSSGLVATRTRPGAALRSVTEGALPQSAAAAASGEPASGSLPTLPPLAYPPHTAARPPSLDATHVGSPASCAGRGGIRGPPTTVSPQSSSIPHPPRGDCAAPAGLPDPAPAAPIHVGWRPTSSLEGHVVQFPRNPESPVCAYYTQTGHCKYGQKCYKDHPEEHAVRLNTRGYPLRPGQEACPYYMLHAECKFGPACKFHHPNLEPVFAGSDLVASRGP